MSEQFKFGPEHVGKRVRHHEKDSVGTPLPERVWINPIKATQEQVGNALAVNSFRLLVDMNLKRGNVVIYDPAKKEATVTDQNGFTTFIWH